MKLKEIARRYQKIPKQKSIRDYKKVPESTRKYRRKKYMRLPESTRKYHTLPESNRK